MPNMLATLSLTFSGAPRARRLSLSAMASLARQRRALARLDADRLADIGLSRLEADAEAARPAWDAPRVWVE